MWYIKEINNIDEMLEESQKELPKILKKVIYLYKYITNKGRIIQLENGYIYNIPLILKNKKIKTKKVEKICENIFKKYNPKNVAISNELEKNDQFKNCLYSKNIHILNGRNLFNILVIDILKYIAEKQRNKLENMEITVLVNDTTDFNIENIKLISQNVKMLSIVTNNINKLKTIQSKLCEEYGILVKLSNNTKKSLGRAKIIVNLDFAENTLNKYNIYNRSIILNVNGDATIYKKSFNGIVIQNFEPVLPLKYITIFKDYNVFNYFNRTILCESMIIMKDTFTNIRKKIERENIDVYRLSGSNGYISDEEFEKYRFKIEMSQ